MTPLQKLLGKTLHAWGAEYKGILTVWDTHKGRLQFRGASLEIRMTEKSESRGLVDLEADFFEEGETVEVARVSVPAQTPEPVFREFSNRVGLYLQGARGVFSG